MERDDHPKSRVERFNARIRNNPLVASLIVVGTIVIAIGSFTDAANKLVASFSRQSPAAARTTLAQMNVAYTADAFVASAGAGDLTALKLFLAAGMDANARSERGLDALGTAAFKGQAPVVALLLKSGARADAQKGSTSALARAAAGGHNDLVRLFLDQKPAPDADTIDAAFFEAERRNTYVETRNYDGMRLLAARGAHVKALAPAEMDELWSRGLGDADAVEATKVLLELGADPNGGVPDDGKAVTTMTPLMGAAAEGYLATVRLLLASGARIDVRYDRPDFGERGWTALTLAILRGKPATVEALVAAGADLAIVNGNGDDALLLAARGGEVGCFRAVLAKAADLRVRDREGRTALMLLAAGVRRPLEGAVVSVESVAALLDRGVSIDERDKAGKTALMLAAESGSAPAVRLLLAKGARTDLRDSAGWRAIDYAKKPLDPSTSAGVVALLH